MQIRERKKTSIFLLVFDFRAQEKEVKGKEEADLVKLWDKQQQVIRKAQRRGWVTRAKKKKQKAMFRENGTIAKACFSYYEMIWLVGFHLFIHVDVTRI